jgi:flagellin
MGLRIATNVAAINAHKNLGMNSLGASKSMERLSSGFRINRAADDAAGFFEH